MTMKPMIAKNKIQTTNKGAHMKNINLNCLLMPNGEILFCGRSLGFFTKEEIAKYATDITAETNKKD